MGFVPCAAKSLDFSGYTVIIPAVSVGNVAQFAVDALITSYSLKKVGFIHDRNVACVVGNDPCAVSPKQANGEMALPIEVFQSEERKLIVVQRRSPVLKGCRKVFCQALFEWIQESGFAKVILLSSSPAFARNDSMLHGAPFGCATTGKWTESFGDTAEDMKWPKLPVEALLQHERAYNPNMAPEPRTGGGIAQHLFRTCEEAKMALLCVAWYATEGDNTHEGLMMASLTDQLLCTKEKHEPTQQWKVPYAWSSLFGPAPDPFLY